MIERGRLVVQGNLSQLFSLLGGFMSVRWLVVIYKTHRVSHCHLRGGERLRREALRRSNNQMSIDKVHRDLQRSQGGNGTRVDSSQDLQLGRLPRKYYVVEAIVGIVPRS